MDGVIIKRARERDIGALTRLLCELYGNISYGELLAENKARFADRKQAFFLAYRDEVPVGCCHGALREEYVNGKRYDGAAGYLEGVYVKPDDRLRGVASALVAACEDWAWQNGCLEFLSDCRLENAGSYHFHLRLGFAETERCVFFRKDLPAAREGQPSPFSSRH